MKICLIERTGISIQFREVAKYLLSSGHQVDFITPSGSGKVDGIRTMEVGFQLRSRGALGFALNQLSYGFASALTIKRLLRQDQYDVIHIEAPASAYFNFLLNGKTMPAVVVSWMGPISGLDEHDRSSSKTLFEPRGWHVPKIIRAASLAVQYYNFKRASRIIVNSGYLREAVVAHYNLAPSKVEVVYTGVDTDLFRPGVDCTALREKLQLNRNDFVVLCVAAIAPYKNQLSLIKAIPQIIAKHPNTKFVFIGSTPSQKYYREIQQFIQLNSLDKNVTFTPQVSHLELPRYYALADGFVLLSTAEGMPATPLEAMSCGKAVILSSIPQNREIARRGDEAIFVAPFDIEAIAEAINNLLSTPELRKRLGQNARRTVLEYLDWKVVAAQIVEVYQEAILRG